MSILITGMEMPKSCVDCFCDLNKCLGKKENITLQGLISRRHVNCPLVPIPKHGRLIDADALDIYRREEQAWHDYEQNPNDEYLEGVKDGLHEAAKQLSIAPTIIQTEEGEG